MTRNKTAACILPLGIIALLFTGGCASISPEIAEEKMKDRINAMNYNLAATLRANESLSGRIVGREAVDVTDIADNSLIGGLLTQPVDILFGTEFSMTTVSAYQYMIRVDNPRNRKQRLLTVLQDNENPIEVGTPVFITWTGYSNGVRVVPVDRPETYQMEGMEEERYWNRREENIKREIRAYRDAYRGD
jgi:hypothetical protein